MEELIKGVPCSSICPSHLADPSFWPPGLIAPFQIWRNLVRDRERRQVTCLVLSPCNTPHVTIKFALKIIRKPTL
jgi:hypothetical protein